MRKSIIFTCGIGLFLAVGQASAHDDRTKEVAPLIEAALTQPMKALTEAVHKDQPEPSDALKLGLAMLAGRTNPEDLDTQGLAALDAHVLPLAKAYMDVHPGKNPSEINWPLILQATPAEAAYVENYERARSADYWLERAVYSVKVQDTYVQKTPNMQDYQFRTMNGQGQFYHVSEMTKAIDTNLILAAAHCIVAVRRAAGINYQPWSELPLSVRLLQALPRRDMQARVDAEIASNKTAYATGAAACGTSPQFESYVAQLKAAG